MAGICAQGDPAPPGYVYCESPTSANCQQCFDTAHPYFVVTPFAYVKTVGWGLVVNQEYQKLYGRDVLEPELWPITGAMAQSNLSIPQIDALIVAQSGTPTRQQPILPLPPSPGQVPPTTSPVPPAPGSPAPPPAQPPSSGSSPGYPPSSATPGAPKPPAAPGGVDWNSIFGDANKHGALIAVGALALLAVLMPSGGRR